MYGHFLAGTKIKGKRIFDVLDKTQATAVFKGIKQSLLFRRPSQTEWVWATTSGTFHTVIRFLPIVDLVMGIVIDQPLFPQPIIRNDEQEGTDEEWFHRSQKFPLTLRERRVVEELKLGKTNREIAQALQITPRTVKFHLSNIFTKLHISSREILQHSEPENFLSLR
jgi:DNA-binding CsgD family transcriptional regulator